MSLLEWLRTQCTHPAQGLTDEMIEEIVPIIRSSRSTRIMNLLA